MFTMEIRKLELLIYACMFSLPDWKNYQDQVHSRPRGSSFSASWGIKLRTPLLKPLAHRGAMLSRGLRAAFNWALIMPREISLSDS